MATETEKQERKIKRLSASLLALTEKYLRVSVALDIQNSTTNEFRKRAEKAELRATAAESSLRETLSSAKRIQDREIARNLEVYNQNIQRLMAENASLELQIQKGSHIQ